MTEQRSATTGSEQAASSTDRRRSRRAAHVAAIQVFQVLIYRFLCDYFGSSISPYFGTYGVEFNGSLLSSKYWISLFACLLVSIPYAFFINRRMDDFDAGLAFLFLVTYIPTTTVWWISDGSSDYFAFVTIFWLLTLWAIVLGLRPRVIHQERPRQSVDWITIVYSSLLLFLALLIYMRFGLPSSFGFDSAYARRSAFNEWLPGGIMAYLFSWSVYVFCVYLIFYQSGWFYRLIGLSFIVLLYSASGDKIYVLIVPVLIYIILVARFQLARFIAPTLSLAVIGSIAFFWLGEIWVPTIAQRMIIVPADISFHYADYFKEPLTYSYSFLSSFSSYGYEKLPGNTIGDVFYTPGDNATAGFLADMYVNLRWWSLVLVVAFFVVLRWSLRPGPAVVLLLPFLFQLIDTPLPTALLTGGGGLMILVALAFSNVPMKPSGARRLEPLDGVLTSRGRV